MVANHQRVMSAKTFFAPPFAVSFPSVAVRVFDMQKLRIVDALQASFQGKVCWKHANLGFCHLQPPSPPCCEDRQHSALQHFLLAKPFNHNLCLSFSTVFDSHNVCCLLPCFNLRFGFLTFLVVHAAQTGHCQLEPTRSRPPA